MMRRLLSAIAVFLGVATSGFSSGISSQVSGLWSGNLVNDTSYCFFNVYTSPSSDGGYCTTASGTGQPCSATLSSSIPVGVSQSFTISTNTGYFVLSYSVYGGTAGCSSDNPCETQDCCQCNSCCDYNSTYYGTFSITIPYGGGQGANYSFVNNDNIPIRVTWDATTNTYKISKVM